jgi:hypothetical protein
MPVRLGTLHEFYLISLFQYDVLELLKILDYFIGGTNIGTTSYVQLVQ